MAKRCSIFFLALFLSCSQASAEGPFGEFNFRGWDVAAYTSDRNGVFSHCAGSASYESGITFLVSVTASMTWKLGFLHRGWQLREGETIPIQLVFDNRAKFQVYGEVIDPHFVVVPMPDDSALIKQFRWARVMTAFAKGRLYGFELTNTSKLLPVLVDCTKANTGKTVADWSPGKKPNVTAANSGASTPVSQDLQIEAIGLATNFMLGAGLQNPRVLSRTETPADLASFGAAWKSDEARGAVMVVGSDAGFKGLDLATTVANASSDNCKGKFASGRDSKLVDSEVVFRGFSSCDDSDGLRSSQFFVVPRQQGGFVVFAVFTDGLEGQVGEAETDLEVGFQRAALTAIE